MEEAFSLYPVVSAPEGISAEHPFPILVSFQGEVPDAILDSENFGVTLASMDDNVLFEDGEGAFHLSLQGGSGQAMAHLKAPASSIQMRAYFFFRARFSGSLEATLGVPAPEPPSGPRTP